MINHSFRFDGEFVDTAEETSFDHSRVYHLGSYVGQPLTTGSHTSNGYTKTEIMNLESGQWVTGPDYPFHSK